MSDRIVMRVGEALVAGGPPGDAPRLRAAASVTAG